MSETPQKPKPGSLRDRIAAFENANKSAAPAPGPAPRPKPSTLQSWKPKVPSPPQSPESERKTAGMSASDAMESIGKGGSLKERMAALQGRGAFGGGTPPPILPKPADKPRWKPPPPVSSPADEVVSQSGAIDTQGSSPPATGDPDPTDLEGGHEAQQDAAEIEQDPEEEERQRRAAIAVRMARLGGARVGMGPPLFAAKPTPRKQATPPPQPKQDEEATLLDSDVTSPPAEAIIDFKEVAQTDPEYSPAPTHKDSDSSSLSLTDSPSNAATSRSMPVPAGPRRAAPPRKKAYKSPPVSQPPEVPVLDAAPEVSQDALDAEPTEEPAAERTTQPEPELEPETRPPVVSVTSQDVVESPEQVTVPSAEQILVIGEVGVSVELDTAEVDPADKLEDEDNRVDADEPVSEQQDQEEEQQEEEQQEQEEQEYEECEQKEEEEEEEEEARRQRVAAKLAEMGAFNPLAGPPPVPHHDSIPSPPTRHGSSPAQLVSVDRTSDIGKTIPSPPAGHVPAQFHTEEELEQAEEEREIDEPTSRAAEFDDGSQPDLGATRRVLYHDEMDEGEQYGSDQLLNEPEAWEPASQPHTLNTPPLPSSSISQEYESRQGDLNQPGTGAHDKEAVLIDAVDSGPLYNPPEIPAPELNPDQHQDNGEMAPARITRPIPPPPVNLSSKPSITPSSPPPPPRPLYALQTDEERPESPAPRPVPPPVKSVKAEEPPAPPSRVTRRTSASIKSLNIVEVPPAPPRVARRTSASVKSADMEEEPPSPPPRIARRTSASIRSVELEAPPVPTSPHPSSRRPASVARRTSASVRSVESEAPPTPPPVSTSPRPSLCRPTSPPIITALPLVVPVTTNEKDTEQEFSDGETPSQPQQFQGPEGDEDSMRRRTIAERMARLGGISFGAPPVPTPLTRPTFPRAPPPTSIPPDEPEVDTQEPEEGDETIEGEAARKQRIAAKLAGMGGMRFGMLPPGAGVAPTTARRLAPKQDDSENEDVALPVPAPTHPARRPLPPVEVDPEQEYLLTKSEDDVRVEMEESEVEEVYYSDADVRESVEEEGPPLPPPRRSSLTLRSSEVLPTPPPRSPPPTVGRPPIPSIPAALLNRRTSIATASSSRKSSADYSGANETSVRKQRIHTALPLERTSSDSGAQSDYVMVEPELEVEEEPVAPPSRRSSRTPRSFPLPPPPPPSAIDPPEQMTSSAQWELPSIPQATYESGDEADLASFSEDSTFHGSTSTPTRKFDSRSTPGQIARPVDQELSADDLMALWGKIGVQVVESATGLFEKSKRSLVGDGSYAGFVKAVFSQVPDVQRVPGEGEDWGYLIYVQSASSVQRRIADILPGDVIAFWDAKLKGHKGLQTYSQTVGTGENGPLVGVVSEVESKKCKVRVWQANQHVGQQTVENVSYRLEDLKSGVVKVFRVMEA